MDRIDTEAPAIFDLGNGTALVLKPLSRRHRTSFLSWVYREAVADGVNMMDPEVTADPVYVNLAMQGMIRYTCDGWSTGGDTVKSRDRDATLDQALELIEVANMTTERKAELLETLQRLTGLIPGEEKNSPASSESQPPARLSIAADG